MSAYSRANIPAIAVSSPSIGDINSPRTARFGGPTPAISPIDGANPFKDPPTNHYQPQPQVSDIGFGYINKPVSIAVEMEETDERYLAQPKTPLKSAMKSPGAPPKNLNGMLSPSFKPEELLSPTWRQERDVEKAEKVTDKEQKRDLNAKIRTRWAKFFLRGVNFGCSLIVLSMLATSFNIFNATKNLPSRNNSPPWAPHTKPWAQIVLLCIACVSLATCVFIFWSYWRGGHRRAEKVAVYYTTLTVAFFIFSIVMWVVGAVIMNQTKASSSGQDLWGWSCKQNRRHDLYQDSIDYDLVCRLQNWSLLCAIIEIVVETIAIVIYGVTFYRYYTKRRLRKTMETQHQARQDLYTAQLRLHSAPNTPGLPGGLLSPRDGGWRPPQGFGNYNERKRHDLKAGPPPLSSSSSLATDVAVPKPFTLGAVPKRHQRAVESSSGVSETSTTGKDDEKKSLQTDDGVEGLNEPRYGAVAVPLSYGPASPGFASATDDSIDARLHR